MLYIIIIEIVYSIYYLYIKHAKQPRRRETNEKNAMLMLMPPIAMSPPPSTPIAFSLV